MPEVKVKKWMWHLGEPVEPGTVIDLPESDTAYLVGIGRVERIEPDDEIASDERPPAEQPPAEQPPADEPPAEQPPADPAPAKSKAK